jgi:hypothetical protein
VRPAKPDFQKLKRMMLAMGMPTKSAIQSVPGSTSSQLASAGWRASSVEGARAAAPVMVASA